MCSNSMKGFLKTVRDLPTGARFTYLLYESPKYPDKFSEKADGQDYLTRFEQGSS